MKKIGFIDYYISEWHANNYPAWIKQACEDLNADYKLCYAWAEKDISDVDGKSTDEWCAEHGVERCDTIAELCEKSDAIMILAPSNPEKHWAYIQEVFPFGKRTYVDKTFAPDAKTAADIFALAEKYNTPFFSTSALRYGDGLEKFIGAKEVYVKGGGGNFEEYCIHQFEILVKLIGLGAEKVYAEQQGDDMVVRIAYPDDRKSEIRFFSNYGYMFTAKTADGTVTEYEVPAGYFPNLAHRIIRFFEDGTVDFPGEQTMEIMKLREAAIKATKAPKTWISL